jgi:hypothetical protein
MLRSKSIAQNNIELFQFFIQETLSGNDNYRSMVENLLEETKDLTIGEKSIYNINRENFPIIVFLSERLPDFFRGIDIRMLKQKDYELILENFQTYQEQLT